MGNLISQIGQKTISLDTFIQEWGENFPLLTQLEQTEQEPEWHGEGNVYIHTQMVITEIEKIIHNEAQHLSDEKKQILTLAALFHDIAKPITTRQEEIKGKIRIASPGHAGKGRSYIAYKLLSLHLPFEVWEKLIALVGHHHDPKWYVVKEQPIHKWRRLARIADLEMLYYLELADIRGRIADDRDEQLEYIEMFRLMAQDYKLWNADPYSGWREQIANTFANESKATIDFLYHKSIREAEEGKTKTPEEAVAKSYQYLGDFSEFILLFGPSGSGKTTWRSKSHSDYEWICLDEIRAELTKNSSDQSKNGQVRQIAKQRLSKALAKKRNVVWDATNIYKDFRSPILKTAHSYNAHTKIICLLEEEKTIRKRNNSRKDAIPNAALEKQLERLDFPYHHEAHKVIYQYPNPS